MPDRNAMIEAVKTHCRGQTEGDLEAWLPIWADDVVIEDPVGAAIYRGIDEVRATFWPQAQNANVRLWLEADVITCGNEAMAICAAEVGPEGERRRLGPIVDHFTFDEAGKIMRMRAFFNY